jgi:DNA-binding transcriptional ArsR family regulator
MRAVSESYSEPQILQHGVDALREMLSPGWTLEKVAMGAPSLPNAPASLLAASEPDMVFRIQNAHGYSAPVLVVAKRSPTPGLIREQIGPYLELMRQLTGDAAVLLVSPWLSPGARAHLDELGYGYLDLTGSVSLRLPSLGIIIKTAGASRAPAGLPRSPWRQQLRGAKAGTLVRLLADVKPGFGATEVATASKLSPPYVSRLLGALEDLGLVRRAGREITDVDWANLLHARARDYPLLSAVPVEAYQARRGVGAAVVESLREVHAEGEVRLAVTGSVAARAVAPLTVGETPLMIHVPVVEGAMTADLAHRLGLLPSSTSAGQVLLLRSPNLVVTHGRRLVDGVPHVALSQLVIDCLGGPGRLPAEGEAVLDVMARDVDAWRKPTITDWAMPTD